MASMAAGSASSDIHFDCSKLNSIDAWVFRMLVQNDSLCADLESKLCTSTIMYLRDVHTETSIPTLRQLIRENPLGVLTTAIKSSTYPLLQSSHIPFVLDYAEGNEANLGVLRGHLARQNPQSKAMMESARSQSQSLPPDPLSDSNLRSDVRGCLLEDEVMVLFTTPVQHYVTPNFYIETKPESGKVVPTWNYAAAQAYGRARIYCDAAAAETVEFLSRQVGDLTRHAENCIMGYTEERSDTPSPWAVSDAPEKYIQLLQKAIIGIEIKIERLEGKFKMSQESGQGDRLGVIQGFASLGSEVAFQMAELVRERGLGR